MLFDKHRRAAIAGNDTFAANLFAPSILFFWVPKKNIPKFVVKKKKEKKMFTTSASHFDDLGTASNSRRPAHQNGADL